MLDTDNFKKNIHDDYEIEEELGSGQFAVVRKIVEKETGDEFAAKYVRKKRTKASRNGMSREDIKREIEILRMVDSEKIIKVHDVYETDKEMILVMELLRGGELFDYISKKDYLTEEEAIDFTRQILQGLQHLHSRSVVHLDLKPENILLKNTRRKTIKLVDFGLARVVKQNEQVREIMGTPEFVAPEVLNFDTISTATDMWALGVIAYILLSGASPFLGEDNQETFTNIIQVDYQFDEEYFAEISDEAKDFIRKLLVKDPRKRPTAHDSSRHPWVEEEVADKKKRQRRRTTQICTFNFKRFVARKRWKMSYNKIRAMNLIAKMGIKPPPGFVTEIPPMAENNENAPPELEEKTISPKEHKKHQSTINRRKHKQSSSPKPAVQKTDSLTLKAMDIDIGEGQSGEPEPELVNENEADKQVEPSPAVAEPVDYGSMSKREKRRARGQLRTDEIAKSKQEIDAKHAKLESDEVGGESGEDAPAMNVELSARDDEKPVENVTVTSTMHIDHKPATKTQSGGILKKRDKGSRIPSTEDHYFVALNAALFQDDAFYPSGLQPTRQHGILKHTTSAPITSEDKTIVSDATTHVSEVTTQVSEATAQVSKVTTQLSADTITPSEGVSNSSEDLPKSNETVPKTSEGKKISEFATVVEVISGGNIPPGVDYPGDASGMVIGLQVEKTVAHEPEKEVVEKKEADTPKADIKPASSSRQNSNTKSTNEVAPTPKKPFAKTDNPSQQRGFTPPPWQRKTSTDNPKPNSKPLHGVSKVSLKANRFLSNDKPCSPKSPTSAAPTRTSNVLGKSKLFQKETNTNKLDAQKTVPIKSNSGGQELKNVACDINLDDSPSKNSIEISVSKPSADSESKPLKTQSDSQQKPLSDSQPKPRSGSSQGNKINKNSNTNHKQEKMNNAGGTITVIGSRSRSNSSQNKISNDEGKVLNGVHREVKESSSTDEISGGNEEAVLETGSEEKGDLKSTSTHSLTEFTIRPRQNSGEDKAGGFDIMLTIAPPSDEPAQESHAVSTKKTRFTSSVSALPDPRSGVPNGKLTSLSTSDMTLHSREAVTSPTERHGAAQGSKYIPQRDFSKYLSSDQTRPIKTTAVPLNTQKSPKTNWQIKRNTPQLPTTVSPKTTITPKSPTSPTTRAPSVTAKTAAAKVSATVAMPKGKKTALTSTAYIPRRSFGFSSKPTNQTENVVKPSEPDDATKLNNNDESKRWSQSSNTSDRSASSASSDELSLSNVTAENNALNCSNTGSSEQISVKNPEISRKIENHSEHGKLSPRASPVLERKWKATLLLPKESEKVPTTKDRDIRISSTNAPRKNKFSNVRSMWEGK